MGSRSPGLRAGPGTPPPEGGPGPGTQGGKDGVERGGSGYTGEGARRSMIPSVPLVYPPSFPSFVL